MIEPGGRIWVRYDRGYGTAPHRELRKVRGAKSFSDLQGLIEYKRRKQVSPQEALRQLGQATGSLVLGTSGSLSRQQPILLTGRQSINLSTGRITEGPQPSVNLPGGTRHRHLPAAPSAPTASPTRHGDSPKPQAAPTVAAARSLAQQARQDVVANRPRGKTRTSGQRVPPRPTGRARPKPPPRAQAPTAESARAGGTPTGRVIRTAQGAARYHAHIGDPITREMQQSVSSGWKRPGAPEPGKPSAAPGPPKPLTIKGKKNGKEVDIAAVRTSSGHLLAKDLQRVKVERTKKGYRIHQMTKEGEIVTEHPELEGALNHLTRILNTHHNVKGGRMAYAGLALFG